MIPHLLFWSSIALILYAYLGYPFLLLIMSKIMAKKRCIRKGSYVPKITLIIPAYNEEGVIEAKIRNSLSLDYPKERLEIIVGSDGSTDLTNTIVSRFADEGVILNYEKQRRGKVRVIQRCIKQASGDVIVFSDANSMLHRDVFRKFAQHFYDPSVGCVCGATHHIQSSEGKAIQVGEGMYYKYESFVKSLEGDLGSVIGATDGFFAIRRSLFSTLTETRADDFEIPVLIRLSGYRVLYDRQIVAEEECSKVFRKQHKRRTRIISWNLVSLVLLLKHSFKKKKLFVAFQLVSHKLLRWLVPIFILVEFLQSLLYRSPLFNFSLGLNLLFFATAGLGALVPKGGKSIPMRLLHISYSFFAMNWSAFIGIIRGILNLQTEIWEKTR